jgi:hypothetical protein
MHTDSVAAYQLASRIKEQFGGFVAVLYKCRAVSFRNELAAQLAFNAFRFPCDASAANL